MDFKISYKDIDTATRAAKMFELQKQKTISIMDGKFKDARKYQKELASTAVKDFETYKTLPFLHFTLTSAKEGWEIFKQSMKFRVYSAFTKKTKDEKVFKKQLKNYIQNLTPEEKKKKTLNIVIPSLYQF